MIQKITIKNIKGISNKTFDLNITPNKPSILVAPNGFGKSSFATAFNSLNSRRIKLSNCLLELANLNWFGKIIVDESFASLHILKVHFFFLY